METPTKETKPGSVAIAKAIAEKAHAGQTRYDGSPYIEHPRRIAKDLEELKEPEYVVAAGWLHDVVEDSPITLKDILAAGVSQRTVALVVALTKTCYEDYAAYIERLVISDDAEAMIIKLADLHDNLRDLKAGHQRDKYQLAQVVLSMALFSRQLKRSKGGSSAPAPAPVPTVVARGRTYIVAAGDTLPFISLKIFDTKSRWQEIYNLNRDQLLKPDSTLLIGQVLKLPAQ